MIKRPMKALSKPITDKQLEKLDYPVYCSPKLDGIRCVVINGQALSSTLKPIGNKYIQKTLSQYGYEGMDGELIVGDPTDPTCFNNTTGAVRREDGKPNFTYHIFDRFSNGESSYVKFPYKQRWLDGRFAFIDLPHVEIVEQHPINNPEDIMKYEKDCINEGYEGIMIRSPNGIYKEGRTTFNEQNIFKRKPILDDEAQIIGFGEQMTNLNEQKINELGLSKRASNKENKVGANTLGYFVVESTKFEKPFHIGTGNGLTQELRKEIWNNQEKYFGKYITYTFQGYGSMKAPRLPIMKGFREKNDITEW